jgi:hypothetical protein
LFINLIYFPPFSQSTGKNIRPDKAKKMGLADIVVDPAALEAVALDTAKALAAGTLKVKRKSKGLVQKVLENTGVGRSIVFGQTEKMVAKSTGGHYPSPTAILGKSFCFFVIWMDVCACFFFDPINTQNMSAF